MQELYIKGIVYGKYRTNNNKNEKMSKPVLDLMNYLKS